MSATADDLPGSRAVVDRHRGHPLDDAMADAMIVATRKEPVLSSAAAWSVMMGPWQR